MSHFVTFGSSGYSSKFTTIFSRKVRGHSNYVNFSFSTQYKIAIFFRVSFHHHEIRSLYSRIFLAKWLLENEYVTNPYDPSKDSIRDLQWGRNRFPMSKLVPSSSSLARKTKWLKGIEKFLLHNVIFDVSTLLRQRCGFLRAILAECLPYRILTIVQCPLRWGSYAVCKSNNSRNISKRKPWKAEENKKKWD